ncbi:protein downstream neighbor of Son-like isoform X1 [Clavelina lepadiformis]|uniref:protein downstream neighbor of Son-like isoform X1 n=2 Tax=Clavelina lepadiformis TaxID=159417 RepID=UPI004041644C
MSERCSLRKTDESANAMWKKPSDVMKKIRLKKKHKLPSRSLSVSQPMKSNLSKAHCNRSKVNPFAKKRSISEEYVTGKKRILSLTNCNVKEGDKQLVSESFGNLLTENSAGFRSVFDKTLDQDQSNDANLSNDDLGFVYLNEDSIQGIFTDSPARLTEKEDKFESCLPPDWTLKTKARFLSSSSFAWCARMKGCEEAESITRSCRCQDFNSDNPKQSDFRVELGKWLIYWQFPCIPWFSLFPRFGPECKLQSYHAGEMILSERMKSSLYDAWVAAFRSAYQMLRQDLCPYFYVCSQQYTAVFRSAPFNQNQQVSCLLTPTSLGFRNSLKTEGIEFSMPMKDKTEKKLNDSSENDAFIKSLEKDRRLSCPFPASRAGDLLDKENQPVAGAVDEGKSGCGEGIGCNESINDDSDGEEELSWKSISSELHFRRSKEVNVAMTNDGLPKTAILIVGLMNTQMLFNHLLNTRSSISTSGPQSGIPPTILSPVAFTGSTLKKLDYRAGKAKTMDGSFTSLHSSEKSRSMQQKFSLDITGPVMPHHLSGVTALLNLTQDSGEYSAAFSTYLHSMPFNALNMKASVENSTKQPGSIINRTCGLPVECITQLVAKSPPVCLRQVTALKQSYAWSS